MENGDKRKGERRGRDAGEIVDILALKPKQKRYRMLDGYTPDSVTSEKWGEGEVEWSGESGEVRGTGGKVEGGNESTLPPLLLDDGKGTLNVNCDESADSDMVISEGDDDSGAREIGDLLQPPKLAATGDGVTGLTTGALRLQNKRRRTQMLVEQQEYTQWVQHQGRIFISEHEWEARERVDTGGKQMYPRGRARQHPAGDLLEEWARYGCPAATGRNWTKEQMQEAIDRGPHQSALEPAALEHFRLEIKEKVEAGQARVVEWDTIKDNPPPQLKISPVAAIPHNSKPYRSILDLSFRLRLCDGGMLPAVNDTTTKTAPQGACDQIGHALKRLIHAFAEADEDAKIFMAKWDIKDGFWRLNCQEGEEWNFAYVLPQPEGQPIRLVIPTSLQMGWIESPPYFCTASETARDAAGEYCETKVGSLPRHKFEGISCKGMEERPEGEGQGGGTFKYLIEVYVDDFISFVLAPSGDQLRHVASAIMHGIHDVFPPEEEDSTDPISMKKMLKGDGIFSTRKCVLGFDFDGESKTIWLEEEKRAVLLTVLKGWLRTATRSTRGIPLGEFESITAKLRHAFTALPEGKGLLSPCNWVLRKRPPVIYLQRNHRLREAIQDARTMLRESTARPTHARELVAAWPDFVGVKDASGQGVGGVIIGEGRACPPTVFRVEWPEDIKADLVSERNRKGRINNSELEMAGLLLLWLVMEAVCGDLEKRHVALFSDNNPTVSWVKRMASRQSRVAAQLLRALALRLHQRHTCPLTPVHIPGKQNSMTDIPSRSFGSVAEWHCQTDYELLTLFNSTFPLPGQESWNVFRLSSGLVTKVISVLRMTHTTLDEWRRLPKIGAHIGTIGPPMSNLWEWTLTYRGSRTLTGCESSQASQQECDKAATVEDAASRLAQSLALSQPLARRSRWPVSETLPR